MPTSAFAKYERQAWPHRYEGTIQVPHLVGGTPNNKRTIEGWIKKNVGMKTDELIQQAVAEVMAERGVTVDVAVDEVADKMNLNGFKRDEQGLYIEGRHLKACLKEGANVARAADKLKERWGMTKKGVLGFVAEHIQVVEDRLHLGRVEPDGIQQRFVQSRYGASIQYEEYAEKVDIDFTTETDWEFTEKEWAMIWLTAERQGIGATRSQGYGTFTLTRWEKLK